MAKVATVAARQIRLPRFLLPADAANGAPGQPAVAVLRIGRLLRFSESPSADASYATNALPAGVAVTRGVRFLDADL